MPFVVDLPADWEGWVAGEGLTEGAPFLISPTYEFDVVLNGYFSQASMLRRRPRPVRRMPGISRRS